MGIPEIIKPILRPVYVPIILWVTDTRSRAQRRVDKRIERGRELIERGRELIERGRELIERGQLKKGERAFRKARALLQRALKLRPDYALPRKLLAWIAAERGDWSEAAALWRRVIATPLPPKESAEALSGLAYALDALPSRSVQTDNELDSLITQLIDNPHGRLQGLELRGRMLLQRGRLKEAEAAAQELLSIQPDYTLATKLLAFAAAEREDWPAAAAGWRKVLDAPMSPPETADVMNSLALALGSTGAFGEAEAVVKRLQANPAGVHLVPKLRMTLAQQSLNDATHATVRRDYHQRYPKAAQQSLVWLRYAGGEDAGDHNSRAAHYTADDLRNAKDAEQARLAMAYLELRLPHAEYLQLSRQTVQRLSDPMLGDNAAASPNKVQAAADLQDEYLVQLLHYMCNGPELEEALQRCRAFARRFPMYSRARMLLAQAAVAANDYSTVKQLVDAMGGGDIELWLAAAEGDHERALAVWQRISRCRYHSAADNRGISMRRLSREPDAALLKRGDRILLFTAFRNEMDFAPWFLDYYRSIGVDWFFIVDNLSNDGTVEYLSKQKDVTLYESTDNYAWAHSAMKWINELIRHYGDGHWCVHVDSDEQLVLPPSGNDGGGGGSKGESTEDSLRRCVDAMTERGEEVMPAYMLDTYPPSIAAVEGFRSGDDPLAVSPLLDPQHFFFGRGDCCFYRVRGGVRDRLFGFHSTLEKAPILRGGGGRFYLSSHHTSYARVSRRCGVLLHHKLMREALDILKPGGDATQRTEDRGSYCRVRHSRYWQSAFFAQRGDIPRSPDTVEYEDAAQLESLGLLGDFNAFQPARTTPLA